ncbi:MAG: DUF370 domain-containing protein [Ruminococcaceae bacterium]|nr:DUF370 domain-containing protein [Oscillospiraceae bacterium]
MYLHLGQEVVVRQKDLIGVFDMDNTTVSGATRQYLTKAQRAGEVITVSPELPRSFAVCAPSRRQGRRQQVYICQLAPRTLQKRSSKEDLT